MDMQILYIYIYIGTFAEAAFQDISWRKSYMRERCERDRYLLHHHTKTVYVCVRVVCVCCVSLEMT